MEKEKAAEGFLMCQCVSSRINLGQLVIHATWKYYLYSECVSESFLSDECPSRCLYAVRSFPAPDS